MIQSLFLTEAEKKIIYEYSKKINLSSLTENDINDLLYFLHELKLELRCCVGVNNSTTFGIEIEFDNAILYKIRNLVMQEQERIKRNSTRALTDKFIWKATDELIITHEENDISIGGEVVSPVMTDIKKSWEQITNICDLIINEGGIITDSCAGHIHFGGQIIQDRAESWKNLMLLILAYEKIYLHFSSGEDYFLRSLAKKYAKALSEELYDTYFLIKNREFTPFQLASKMHDTTDREYSINFKNLTSYNSDKETIEIRCPNGTLNPVIWQNTFSFFARFLDAANRELDVEKLESKIMPISNDEMMNEYYKFHVDLAIELADLIFDTSIDKLYFLKQYVKDELDMASFGGKTSLTLEKKKALHK